MPFIQKPDPYCDFKNDDQRRRALNVRVISQAITRTVGMLVSVLAIAHTGFPKEAVLWFKPFLH
jgi:hypothetical protein